MGWRGDVSMMTSTDDCIYLQAIHLQYPASDRHRHFFLQYYQYRASNSGIIVLNHHSNQRMCARSVFVCPCVVCRPSVYCVQCELTAWLPWPVHGDFDGAVVSGHLGRARENGYGQGETLSCVKRKTKERFRQTDKFEELRINTWFKNTFMCD